MNSKLTSAHSQAFTKAWHSYIQIENENGINVVQEFAFDLAKELVPANHMNKKNTVLDIGCGTGVFYEECRRRDFIPDRYFGFDVNAGLLEECRFKNWENAEFSLLDAGDIEALSTSLTTIKADLLASIRLLNYLNDKEAHTFLKFLVNHFKTSVFVMVLPIERSVSLEPSDTLTAIPCNLEFEGITETHYLRHITQYEAALNQLGASVIRTRLADLRDAGTPTHSAVFGIL